MAKFWYETAVWQELIRVNSSDEVMGGHNTFRTVSSVASGAGVSRGTARKYLEAFVEGKHASKIVDGKSVMYGVNLDTYN